MPILDLIPEYPDSAVVPGAKLVAGLEWSARPELRMAGVGASEAAAALGLDEYAGPLALWARKTGRAAAEDISDEASVRHGHLGEPYLLDRAAELGVAAAERQVLCARPEYPFLHATLDGVTAGREPVEAKTCSPDSRAGVAIASALSSGGVGREHLPERWVLQVHQQMLLAGARRAFVAALVWGRCDAVVVAVERDDELLGRMLAGLERFWGHVLSGTPPEPGHVDLATLKAVRPDAGSIVQLPASCARDADALAEAEAEVAACDLDIALRVRDLKERKRAAERRRDEARARLLRAVGGAEVGVLPDGRRIEAPMRTRRAHEVKQSEWRQLSVRGRKAR